MFQPVNPKVSFPELEGRILDFWKREEIFRRSIDERPADNLYTWYEGPPTANARPGIHHVLTRVFKDLLPRYKTMRGYRVPRKAGWDTHGLPVELEIEKELGLSSKPEIEAFGIAAFNEKCKESVGRYVKEWTDLSDRIGFWADLEHPYVTYHNEYIESCWWIFKQLWDHGLVYQDYRVTPHCPRCGTSLSDHEVSQGYEDNTPDPSVFVRFRVDPSAFEQKLLSRGSIFDDPGQVALVAWTTTPWTLPGNTGLAVKEDAVYGLYRDGDTGDFVVLATALAEKVLGEGAESIATFYGRMLVGLEYFPLYEPENLGVEVRRFDAEGRLRKLADPAEAKGLRQVIGADYVSMDDGSGIVHIAPAFGAEDFAEGKHFGMLFAQPIDLRGVMAEGLPGAGKFAKQADKDVIADLEQRGLMLKSGTIRHTYPFCWRCHTPLLYYAKPSWYMATSRIKNNLLDGNQKVNWYPEHLKNGRYGNWLENNIDWAFSRERYWGTPLPFFRCANCQHDTCIGSKADLVRLALDPAKAEALDDFHRPYIDEILVRCEACGGEAKRVPEVADAWFDSGAMPYAQWHYPFENSEGFEHAFPADFICEAIDQTRGWFYSLHAEAALLQASEAVPQNIAYKNVICVGHIQDEKGNKMSKSRGNAVEPWSVIDKHGADATRWYMYTASPAGSSRRFSSGLVEEGLRRFLLTLWNTYSFFVSYANIDGLDPRKAPSGPRPEIDRWLLSELNALVIKVTDELDAYDPTDAGRAIEAFVDDLSNWYVRRNRRRFWRGVSESDEDKLSAYNTLWTALTTVSQLLAPFTPFVAEELWQNLVRSVDAEAATSVHLAAWPVADASLIDASLNNETQLVKRISSLGRAARAKAQLKVRQPLAELAVVALRPADNARLAEVLGKYSDSLLEELNAKEFLSAESGREVFKPQFKLNLKDFGREWADAGEMAARQKSLANFNGKLGLVDIRVDPEKGLQLNLEAKLTDEELGGVKWEGQHFLFDLSGTNGFEAAYDGRFAVAVSTAITPELADEGLARELVRRIQDLRREANFDLADRITTYFQGDGDVARVMDSLGDYIRGETLSLELVDGPAPEGATVADADLEGVKVSLGVQRIS